ncbi:hypothetical protein LOK82_00020 [Xylella fastidiosa subsp. multiplex]|uniref:Uncharacterized protein n=1 Tax=Xylella fastidiosa subsp. multiplex TaxID=644357 RepID=A0AAW6HSQ2_XYLFS|nr:hypothetical protein [Xylella fastidiosa subsp. multiplex]
MPIRFLPPQPKGLKFDIPGEYKYSGWSSVIPSPPCMPTAFESEATHMTPAP